MLCEYWIKLIIFCVSPAYKVQLEEKKQQTVELEKSTVALDEHAKKLHKQFVFNQENFERYKLTTILSQYFK